MGVNLCCPVVYSKDGGLCFFRVLYSKIGFTFPERSCFHLILALAGF